MTEANPIRSFIARFRNEQTTSLLERIEELRGRIVRCAFLVFGIFVGCFAYAKHLLAFIEQPLLGVLPEGRKAVNFTGPLDVFACYIKVSFMVAVIIAAPILFYQCWRFVAPALKPEDRRHVMPMFSSSLILLAIGMAFCFFVMMPVTLDYLIGTGKEVAIPTIMIEDYVSMVVFMLLGFGAVFQLPLVMVILEALGIVTYKGLAKSRGVAVVVILTVAAAVTPTPDPLTQLGMAVPMYVLYEAALVVIKLKRSSAPKALPS